MDTYSKTYLLLFNAIMSCVDRQSKQTRAWRPGLANMKQQLRSRACPSRRLSRLASRLRLRLHLRLHFSLSLPPCVIMANSHNHHLRAGAMVSSDDGGERLISGWRETATGKQDVGQYMTRHLATEKKNGNISGSRQRRSPGNWKTADVVWCG